MRIDGAPIFLLALTPARLVLWPALGGAGATLVAAIREGRRRTALNECLHELRRPLQALALLASRDSTGRDGAGEGPVEMAAAALARLEREINGGGEEPPAPREALAVRPLLEAAARRWRPQAAMRGKRLALRWDADEAVVEGGRIALAEALDNLVANALEHGGEQVELAADLDGERVCIAVVDTGDGARRTGGGDQLGRTAKLGRAAKLERPAKGRDGFAATEPYERPAEPPRGAWSSLARALRRRDPRSPHRDLASRALRGHGLRLVRRTAARHGGSFALHSGERGTSAVLQLPLAPSRWSEPMPPGFATAGERSAVSKASRPGTGSAAAPRPEIVIRKGAR